MVRLAQRVLRGEARDRAGIVGLDRLALPLREQVRGRDDVARRAARVSIAARLRVVARKRSVA